MPEVSCCVCPKPAVWYDVDKRGRRRYHCAAHGERTFPDDQEDARRLFDEQCSENLRLRVQVEKLTTQNGFLRRQLRATAADLDVMRRRLGLTVSPVKTIPRS